MVPPEGEICFSVFKYVKYFTYAINLIETFLLTFSLLKFSQQFEVQKIKKIH